MKQYFLAAALLCAPSGLVAQTPFEPEWSTVPGTFIRQELVGCSVGNRSCHYLEFQTTQMVEAGTGRIFPAGWRWRFSHHFYEPGTFTSSSIDLRVRLFGGQWPESESPEWDRWFGMNHTACLNPAFPCTGAVEEGDTGPSAPWFIGSDGLAAKYGNLEVNYGGRVEQIRLHVVSEPSSFLLLLVAFSLLALVRRRPWARPLAAALALACTPLVASAQMLPSEVRIINMWVDQELVGCSSAIKSCHYMQFQSAYVEWNSPQYGPTRTTGWRWKTVHTFGTAGFFNVPEIEFRVRYSGGMPPEQSFDYWLGLSHGQCVGPLQMCEGRVDDRTITAETPWNFGYDMLQAISAHFDVTYANGETERVSLYEVSEPSMPWVMVAAGSAFLVAFHRRRRRTSSRSSVI